MLQFSGDIWAKVGFDDLAGHFQRLWFYDAMAYHSHRQNVHDYMNIIKCSIGKYIM